MNNRYKNLHYIDLDRWNSFWYQIKEVLGTNPEKILEVGVGGHVVYNYLKGLGKDITSIDIDPNTKPDVVGSVSNMPFSENEFDTVLCAEVLEHMPYEQFADNLKELKRVSKEYIVLTLPHWGRHVSIDIRIPKFKRLRWQYKFQLFPIQQKLGGEHFWEIGKKGYPLKKVKKTIESAGFEIEKDYINFDMPYHHVFILKKMDESR